MSLRNITLPFLFCIFSISAGLLYLPPLTKAEYAATKFNSVVSSDPNEEASKGGKSPNLNLLKSQQFFSFLFHLLT